MAGHGAEDKGGMVEGGAGRTLYLECQSGVAGDMLVAALLDLGADEEAMRRALDSLPVDGFTYEVSRVEKNGLDCCDFAVTLDEGSDGHDHDDEYLYGGIYPPRGPEEGSGPGPRPPAPPRGARPGECPPPPPRGARPGDYPPPPEGRRPGECPPLPEGHHPGDCPPPPPEDGRGPQRIDARECDRDHGHDGPHGPGHDCPPPPEDGRHPAPRPDVDRRPGDCPPPPPDGRRPYDCPPPPYPYGYPYGFRPAPAGPPEPYLSAYGWAPASYPPAPRPDVDRRPGDCPPPPPDGRRPYDCPPPPYPYGYPYGFRPAPAGPPEPYPPARRPGDCPPPPPQGDGRRPGDCPPPPPEARRPGDCPPPPPEGDRGPEGRDGPRDDGHDGPHGPGHDCPPPPDDGRHPAPRPDGGSHGSRPCGSGPEGPEACAGRFDGPGPDGPDGHGHDHPHDHDGDPHAHHHHEHRGLPEIEAIINAADLTDGARELALRTFRILAQAESQAHGVPVDQVHFHEVGAVDSIVDIVAASALLDSLHVDQVVVPVLVDGRGFVRCQHGIIPVPVPATLNICAQNGLPLAQAPLDGELVTPTGAALVAALEPSTELPERYVVDAVGLGAGKRERPRPSILRAMLIHEAPAQEAHPVPAAAEGCGICKLECDIDDASGEQLAYAADRLREAGAREVHWLPVYTKKNRPAYQLQVICDEQDVDRLELTIFRETTTLGVRCERMDRAVLERSSRVVETPFGPVHVKCATLPDGTLRCSPEYDDCAAIAEREGVPFQQVMDAARDAASKG